MLIKKIMARLYRTFISFLAYLYTGPKRIWLLLLSIPIHKTGKARAYQPVLISGKGKITFGKNVKLGVIQSPYFYSTYGYLEARGKNAEIIIKDDVWINNNVCIVADNTSIIISEKSLIGVNVEIIDSNFHNLLPEKRHKYSDPNPKPVFIGKNVFIGNNVKIFKGVTIGENSVIGNSSIVTKSIPENVIATGNPCKIIRSI